MQALRLALFLLVISGVKSQSPIGFANCDRDGQTCDGGNCDLTTDPATCVCATGETLYGSRHCVADSAADCDNALCSNNGVCKVIGIDNVCYCNQDFFGDDCSQKRLSIECTGTTINVNVTPIETFSGRIYSTGFHAAPAPCDLEPVAGATETRNKEFDISDASNLPCGITRDDYDPDGDNVIDGTMYTGTVMVAFSPNLRLQTDLQLTFTCINNNNGEAISSIPTVLGAPGDVDQGEGKAETDPLELRLFMKAPGATAYSPVDGSSTIKVGYSLKLGVLMKENSDYTVFKVNGGTVNNGLEDTDDDYLTLPVVDDGGCPANEPILSALPELEDVANVGKQVNFFIKAFIFVNDNTTNNEGELDFSFSVLLCADGTDTRCDHATNCPDHDKLGTVEGVDFSAPTSRRRRRRSATNGDASRLLERTIRVTVGDTTVQETVEEDDLSGSDTKACLQNPKLQAIVSVLGVLVFLLLLALIAVLAFVVCRRRRQERKKEEDAYSTTSSTATLPTLHIPRPKV